MSRKKLFLLSLLSGALLFLGWNPHGFPVFLFFAFVPLLRIEQAFSSGETKAKKSLLFWLSYLTFFTWNVSTTWWIWNASAGGAVMAILANSLLMSMTFWIFHIVKKRLLISNFKLQTLNWLFPVFWLGFEYFHHQWEGTWPWLTLGNSFADTHKWIQWYEYTGTAGGSLWALAVNILIFHWLFSHKPQTTRDKPGQENYKGPFVITAIISLPIIVSFFIYSSYKEKENPVDITVVQPNIDPYSEKFGGMDFVEQLEKMFSLAKQKADSLTDYVVFPETALANDICENDLSQDEDVQAMKKFLLPYPNMKIVTGASTYCLYPDGERPTPTARKLRHRMESGHAYYDAFNTAFQIDHSDSVQVYHKSKLVPGVERMPYPEVLGFLENFAIDLGGTSGSLGTQEERSVFSPPLGDGGAAPVICYESIYGEYVGDYIKNGATLIFIITNDGWWGNTPGYSQHLLYGRLRAIETRRSIARSANTGISCFINQRGDFSQQTKWWEPAVIRETINANDESTFYVRQGDYIGRASIILSGLLLLLAILLKVLNRKSSHSL